MTYNVFGGTLNLAQSNLGLERLSFGLDLDLETPSLGLGLEALGLCLCLGFGLECSSFGLEAPIPCLVLGLEEAGLDNKPGGVCVCGRQVCA